jgi:hypothetical protein
MLTLDRDREYFVYPSWADLPYSWDRLPALLSDPKNSGFLSPGRYADYPTQPPRVDFLAGAAGGGVIAAYTPPGERWLGALVLVSRANALIPSGRALVPADPFGPLVTYLEPREDRIGPRTRPKLYLCGATPEHAAAAGPEVYWLASVERGRGRADLSGVPAWATAFGLSVHECPDVPDDLRAETTDWFVQPGEFDPTWFRVSGGGERAGFHFAALVYVALHARSVTKRLHAIHLVADIEGRPNFRKTWHRR